MTCKQISLFVISLFVMGCAKTVKVVPNIPEPHAPIYGPACMQGKNTHNAIKRNCINPDGSNFDEREEPLAEAIPGWTDAKNSELTREKAYLTHLDELSRHQRINREKIKSENAVMSASYDNLERIENQQREMKKRSTSPNSPTKPLNLYTNFNLPANKN